MTLALVRQFYGVNGQAATYYDPATGSRLGYASGTNPNTGNSGFAIGGYNPFTGNAGAVAAKVDPENQTAKAAAGVCNVYTGDWAYLMAEVDKAAGTFNVNGEASNGASLNASRDVDGNQHLMLDTELLDINMANGQGTIENHKTGRTIVVC